MDRNVRIGLALVTGVLAACGSDPRWLRVERIDAGTGTGIVAVNQDLVVHFSEPIDAETVSPESFRVRDAAGHTVRGGLHIGSRSVRFRPVPPVTAALDDGSFRPGETYRLEVAGMPTSFAIRSRAGAVLEGGVAREFTVAQHASQLGLPTPFLPVDGGDVPLRIELSPVSGLRIAADTGVLQLRFSAPVLPGSVRPAAFHFERIGASPAQAALGPVSARVTPGDVPGAAFPGSTVQLEFAPSAALTPGEPLFLLLATGDDALLDYRGRPVEPLPWPVPVKVDAGDRVRLLDLDLSELEWERDADVPLGFGARFGRIVAGGFVEAGRGVAGALEIHDRVTWTAAGQLVDAQGAPVLAANVPVEPLSLYIAPDAELRIEGGGSAHVLRVVGDMRVDGRLLLVDTGRELPWTTGDRPGLESLLRESGCAFLVGGRLSVGTTGSIVAIDGRGATATPLVVVSGGGVLLEGPVAPRCTFALPEAGRIDGVAEGAVLLTLELTPGLPHGCMVEAAAHTTWLPLPAHRGAIDVSLFEPRDGVFAWIQIAPPHSVVAGRPLVDEQFTTPPITLPTQDAIVVPHGGFFRIGLRGYMRDAAVPSIRGFAITDR